MNVLKRIGTFSGKKKVGELKEEPVKIEATEPSQNAEKAIEKLETNVEEFEADQTETALQSDLDQFNSNSRSQDVAKTPMKKAEVIDIPVPRTDDFSNTRKKGESFDIPITRNDAISSRATSSRGNASQIDSFSNTRKKGESFDIPITRNDTISSRATSSRGNTAQNTSSNDGNNSVKKKKAEAFEISLAPTDGRKSKTNQAGENHSDSDGEVDLKRPPINLTEDSTEEEIEKEALQKCKELYGHDIAYNLQSTQWANRKEGVEMMDTKISDLKPMIQDGRNIDVDELKEKFRVSIIVTRKCLKDPVAPVCFSAFELFRNAMKVFCPILDNSYPIKNLLGSMVGPFIHKMGGEATGTNRRNQGGALKCLLRLARTPQVDGLGIIVSKLADESIPARPRLSLLKLLINEFEFKGQGLKLQMVMAITLPALQIADDKTRKAAVGVIVAAYEVGGKRVLKHLNFVKPAILKIIHRKLKESDEVRGVIDSPFFTDTPVVGERPKTGAVRPITKEVDQMQIAGRAYLPHLDPDSSPERVSNQNRRKAQPESDSEVKTFESLLHSASGKVSSDQDASEIGKQIMREKFIQQQSGAYGMGGNKWNSNTPTVKENPPPSQGFDSNFEDDDELLMEKILSGAFGPSI